MKPLLVAVLALSMSLPGAAIAGNGNGKAKGHIKVEKVRPASGVGHGAQLCPPGLAKKSVPCVPPGHAKRYRVGDPIIGPYVVIEPPQRHGLRGDRAYVRVADYVYRIDPDTRKVLNLIGAVADVLD